MLHFPDVISFCRNLVSKVSKDMPSVRDGRSSSISRDRPSRTTENPRPHVVSGYTPFKTEPPPLGTLLREVPHPRRARGILQKGEGGLSKSQSMSVPRIDSHRQTNIVKKASTFSTSKRPLSPPSTWNTQNDCLSVPASASTSVSASAHESSGKELYQRRFKSREIQESDESDFTCPICLEILYRPRELSCGHIFCLTCLQSYSNTCLNKFTCPSCRQIIDHPANGVSDLPRNLNLEKMAEQLRNKRNALARRAKVCLKCHSELEIRECGHCGKGWCYACYPSHLKEVKEEITRLRECLEESKERLFCKKEEEETRFNKLEEKIKEAIEMKKEELTSKVQTLREMSQGKVLRLSQEVEKTLNNLFLESQEETSWDETWKKYNEINLLLASVSSSMEPRVTFDISSLTLSSAEDPSPDGGLIRRPSNVGEDEQDEEEDERLIIPKDHGALYRKKSSYSKYRWGQNICSRPAGIAISPWTGHLFVTASDSCKIHIFDANGKQINSFGCRGHRDGCFLCPIGITFSLISKELYITDKWKHCVHVFDPEGRFLRQIGKKGKGFGEFSSPEGIATDITGIIYVADTCNDRVQILDSDGVFLGEIGLISSEILWHGRPYTMREFNEPVGVAVSPDGSKIYVADSGNHRIRVFNRQTGERLLMFGSRGHNKGQFESPESVIVDEKGFILVGDSGNGRIQIFRPNGRFVRALGTKSNRKGEFGWVSGLALTKNNEIIVTDFKNNTISAF